MLTLWRNKRKEKKIKAAALFLSTTILLYSSVGRSRDDYHNIDDEPREDERVFVSLLFVKGGTTEEGEIPTLCVSIPYWVNLNDL